MQKLICVVIMLCAFSNCNSTTQNLASKNPIEKNAPNVFDGYDSLPKDVIFLYSNIQESDTALKFRSEKISKKEFLKYKRLYNSRIQTDSSRISVTDTSFSILTPDKILKYKANRKDYRHFSYYLGFLKPLHLHIISDIDAQNEVGSLLLVDSKSGMQYYVESPFDYPCETVLISPNNKYLLAYANNYYEDNESYVKVLKINTKKDTYTLDLFAESLIARWQILDIVWINEASFALHVKETIQNDSEELFTEEPGEKQYYFKAFFEK